MIATKEEEIFRIFHFVCEQQTNRLQRLLSSKFDLHFYLIFVKTCPHNRRETDNCSPVGIRHIQKVEGDHSIVHGHRLNYKKIIH